jgi:hypothetical protein
MDLHRAPGVSYLALAQTRDRTNANELTHEPNDVAIPRMLPEWIENRERYAK